MCFLPLTVCDQWTYGRLLLTVLLQRERETLDGGLVPETAEDLEKLVLTSSDDSVLWIRFMAFHLQNSRIEEARATGQKALQTISFR